LGLKLLTNLHETDISAFIFFLALLAPWRETFLSQRRKERKDFFGYQNSNGYLHIQNFEFPFLLAAFAPWRELFLSPRRTQRITRYILLKEKPKTPVLLPRCSDLTSSPPWRVCRVYVGFL
jgi:hypothetical protein